jgi:hypothetical protein
MRCTPHCALPVPSPLLPRLLPLLPGCYREKRCQHCRLRGPGDLTTQQQGVSRGFSHVFLPLLHGAMKGRKALKGTEVGAPITGLTSAPLPKEGWPAPVVSGNQPLVCAKCHSFCHAELFSFPVGTHLVIALSPLLPRKEGFSLSGHTGAHMVLPLLKLSHKVIWSQVGPILTHSTLLSGMGIIS